MRDIIASSGLVLEVSLLKRIHIVSFMKAITNMFYLAKFPFIPGATDFVKANAPPKEEWMSPTWYAGRVLNRATDRILQAIDNLITPNTGIHTEDAIVEIFSYPLARILVSCTDSDYLIKRYALAEAKLAYNRLKLMPISDFIDLAQSIGLDFTNRGKNTLEVHFTQYIQLSSPLGEDWKLVNRELKNGMVELNPTNAARLTQEAIRIKIETGLPAKVPVKLKTAFAKQTTNILNTLIEANKNNTINQYNTTKLTKLPENDIPPCINIVMNQLSQNINISHHARFALAAFLINVGTPQNIIIELFKQHAPDFAQDKTTYQVEHIAGSTGTKYTCPSCQTMQSNELCPTKKECKNIKNPLVFYRRKTKTSKRR